MKIPLSQLRFSNDQNQVWGLNVARNILKIMNFLHGIESLLVQRDGSVKRGIKGLKNIKPQKQIEIQPFIVTKLDQL